jgi:hypothetical protein
MSFIRFMAGSGLRNLSGSKPILKGAQNAIVKLPVKIATTTTGGCVICGRSGCWEDCTRD